MPTCWCMFGIAVSVSASQMNSTLYMAITHHMCVHNIPPALCSACCIAGDVLQEVKETDISEELVKKFEEEKYMALVVLCLHKSITLPSFLPSS